MDAKRGSSELGVSTIRSFRNDWREIGWHTGFCGGCSIIAASRFWLGLGRHIGREKVAVVVYCVRARSSSDIVSCARIIRWWMFNAKLWFVELLSGTFFWSRKIGR